MTSARNPCLLRTHNERCAPASRKREVSVPPVASRSSLMATVCSSVAQSHDSPFTEQIPCPNCVILTAVHRRSGRAAIRPATTLVFPTLRECPPITKIAILFAVQNGGKIPRTPLVHVETINCLDAFWRTAYVSLNFSPSGDLDVHKDASGVVVASLHGFLLGNGSGIGTDCDESLYFSSKLTHHNRWGSNICCKWRPER